MNSNNSNNSNNNSHSSNNINKSKLRTKRPYGALQNQYPEFYTASSKKFKYSNDSNINIIAFNSDNNNKKNAVVFSSFSNDVDMNNQGHVHNQSKYLDSCNPDIKRYLIVINLYIK